MVDTKFKKVYSVDDYFFSSITDESAWLLGLLGADGYIKEAGERWGLSQSGEDGYQLISDVSAMLKFTGKVRESATSRKPSYSIAISSKQMCKDLEEYGIVMRKTATYALPNLPDDKFPAFMRGYIDGDGSVGVYDNGKGCKYLCLSFVGTPQFIESVQDKTPVPGRLRKISGTAVQELRFNGKKAIAMCKWLYGNDSLPESKKTRVWKNYEVNFRTVQQGGV